ncbi:MAG: response regulator transcription factor [Nakamurella sp.]
MRVLLAEDEPLLADAIGAGLRAEAIAVDIVLDGQSAIDRMSVYDYDVVALDRDIPVVHGDDVCRWIVAHRSASRVLMLTAATTVRNKVDGLRLGADDYLTKPFEFPELVARLRALNRRSGVSTPPVLEYAGVQVDPYRRETYRDGRYLRLARKEFATLELLVRAGGGVVSAEQLLAKAWDCNADPFTNAVRIVISTLRRKLGEPQVIFTEAGVGYYLADDSSVRNTVR